MQGGIHIRKYLDIIMSVASYNLMCMICSLNHTILWGGLTVCRTARPGVVFLQDIFQVLGRYYYSKFQKRRERTNLIFQFSVDFQQAVL